jgi:prepilin-type N-terminal cleavage/methylation domain-containing protein
MRDKLNSAKGEHGFTLTEMLIATAIVLFGLVAVAQLVPTSMLLNSNNRNDSTALVIAQRQLEAMRAFPLTQLTFADPRGVTCPLGNTCNLGDPTQPKVVVGGPVVPDSYGEPIINFSAAPVPGYSFTYTDPNDPYGVVNDVRWAVITTTNGPITTGRRIIVGVFRRGMKTPFLPITLDVTVVK